MNLQRCITLTVFFVCCLPFVSVGASSQNDDLTYGFLGDPLPAEVTLYEGVIDTIDKNEGVISVNDTLYRLNGFALFLTASKTKTSLEYFKPAASIEFYAHVQDKVIYEIMAVRSSEESSGTQAPSSEKDDTLILEDGVWRN